MARQLIVGRPDRLGMRLVNILQAWRFARITGHSTIAHWPPSDVNHEKDSNRKTGDYELSLFFDLAAIRAAINPDELSFEESSFPTNRICVTEDPNLKGKFPNHFQRNEIDSLPPLLYVNRSAAGLRFVDETQAVVRAECSDLFKKLVPAGEISAAVRKCNDWIGPAPFIAVHLRRGDISQVIRTGLGSPDIEKTGISPHVAIYLKMLRIKLTPIAALIRMIHTLKINRLKVVVFSDSPEIAARLQAGLGPKQECLLMHECITPELEPNQRALVELMVMSESSILLGTKSAFSRCAHLIGRCVMIDLTDHSPEKNAIETLDEICGDLLSDKPALRQACIRIIRKKAHQQRYLPVRSSRSSGSARTLEKKTATATYRSAISNVISDLQFKKNRVALECEFVTITSAAFRELDAKEWKDLLSGVVQDAGNSDGRIFHCVKLLLDAKMPEPAADLANLFHECHPSRPGLIGSLRNQIRSFGKRRFTPDPGINRRNI